MKMRLPAGGFGMAAVIAVCCGAGGLVVAAPNIGGVNTNRFADADLAHAAQVRQIDTNTLAVGLIKLNKQERTLTVPAKVNMVEQVIEYALVTSDGKRHESLLTTDAQPRDLHVAALLLGVKPSSNLGGTTNALAVPPSAQVEIEITWPIHGGMRRMPLNQLISKATDPAQPVPPSGLETLEAGAWLYSGSEVVVGSFRAQAEGSFISLINDPAALINNPLPTRMNDKLHLPNKTALPPLNTPVQVVFRVRPDVSATTPATNRPGVNAPGR